jgi:hypothetical protein
MKTGTSVQARSLGPDDPASDEDFELLFAMHWFVIS